MKNLVIIAAGGCGREVLQWAKDINEKENRWNIKGFIDDDLQALGGLKCDVPILATIDDYEIQPDDVFTCSIGDVQLKRKICEQCYVCSIISLPVRAFFNTSKKTYIITLEKKTADADGRFPRQDKPVFCYICLSIGEQLDTYRFPTDDNDLKDAVDNYNIWRNVDDPQMEALIEKRAKGRFKALDVAEFNPAKSWIIENWWSEEEKIVIGLKKEQKKQTVEDFIDLVSETEDLLHGIKGELECLK